MNEFSSLGLPQTLVNAVDALGFTEPTDIQREVIPKLLNDTDRDLIGLAQTGTGKTAAFGLPLLSLVDADLPQLQALILSPTRELCLQITRELQSFNKGTAPVKITPVYGGADISKQIRAVKRATQIIVATPGRLRDLIRRKAADLSNLRYLVLDEADEMLNMGFKEELDDILTNTPAEKTTWLFSATMPPEVRRIASEYMEKPFEVSIGEKNTSNADIDHQYVITRPRDRYAVLRRFLDFDPNIYGLVFTRTRRDARELADQLSRDGYNADALHGDLNQSQRDRVMDLFRRKRLRILVATDVAARGIDVTGITHVFHFNIPDDLSFYTHRSGRTGRAGNTGISLVLMHPNDHRILKRLEKIIKTQFTLAHIPTGKEICEQRLYANLQRLVETEINPDVEEFMPKVRAQLGELDHETLLKKIATASFNRFLRIYRDAPDLNPGANKKKRSLKNAKRLFINVGTMDLPDKGAFLQAVCGATNVPGSAIGKIEMNRQHTFFDVDEAYVTKVANQLNGTFMDGRAIRVNRDAGEVKPDFKKKKKKFKKSFKPRHKRKR